jgi:hypothetical protein
VIRDAAAEGKDLVQFKAQTPVALQIFNIFIGLTTVYSFLFAIGFFVYAEYAWGGVLMILALSGAFVMSKVFDRIRVL